MLASSLTQRGLVAGVVVVQQVVVARFAAGRDSEAADESQDRSDAGLSGVGAIAVGAAAEEVTPGLVGTAIAVLRVPVVAAQGDRGRIGIRVLDLAERSLRIALRIGWGDRVPAFILEVERIAVAQHDVVGAGAALE